MIKKHPEPNEHYLTKRKSTFSQVSLHENPLGETDVLVFELVSYNSIRKAKLSTGETDVCEDVTQITKIVGDKQHIIYLVDLMQRCLKSAEEAEPSKKPRTYQAKIF